MNSRNAAAATSSRPATVSPTVRRLSQLAHDTVATWRQRTRNRALLASFDARMLEDIGVSQADAWRESRKPFWQE